MDGWTNGWLVDKWMDEGFDGVVGGWWVDGWIVW